MMYTQDWMNECLTTPQHKKQIGYWVSEKGITQDMQEKTNMTKKVFNDTPAQSLHWLMCIREKILKDSLKLLLF